MDREYERPKISYNIDTGPLDIQYVVNTGPVLRAAKKNEHIYQGTNGIEIDGIPYSITEIHKSGGMGVVYRAIRADKPGERRSTHFPNRLIIKQATYPVSEAIIAGSDAVEAFIYDWADKVGFDLKRNGRSANPEVVKKLRSHIQEKILDSAIQTEVMSFIGQRHSVLGVLQGLKDFNKTDVAKRARADLDNQVQDFIREFGILKLLEQHHVRGVPRVFGKVKRISSLPISKEKSLDNYFFAVEEADGKSISDWYKERTYFTEKIIIQIMLQLLDTLAQIHDLGLIHRDITPGNVMIDLKNDMPSVTLIDFGITIAKNGSLAEKELKKNRVSTFIRALGTDGYAAPEVATNKTSRTIDTFGAGRLLFYLLTGGVEPKDDPSAFMQQLNASNIKQELKVIIARATHPEFESRDYVQDIRDALASYAQKNGGLLLHKRTTMPRIA